MTGRRILAGRKKAWSLAAAIALAAIAGGAASMGPASAGGSVSAFPATTPGLATPLVSPRTVAPGGTLSVSGAGCFALGGLPVVAFVSLVDGHGNLLSTQRGAITGGAWQVLLPVPPAATLGIDRVVSVCDQYAADETYPSVTVTVALPTPVLATNHLPPGKTLTVRGQACALGSFGYSYVFTALVGDRGNIVATGYGYVDPGSGSWQASMFVPEGTPLGSYLVDSTCDAYYSTVPYPAVPVLIGMPALSVLPAKVAPGGTVTVRGASCSVDNGYPVTAFASLADGSGDFLVTGSSTVAPDGTWQVSLVVPRSALLGLYAVEGSCDQYVADAPYPPALEMVSAQVPPLVVGPSVVSAGLDHHAVLEARVGWAATVPPQSVTGIRVCLQLANYPPATFASCPGGTIQNVSRTATSALFGGLLGGRSYRASVWEFSNSTHNGLATVAARNGSTFTNPSSKTVTKGTLFGLSTKLVKGGTTTGLANQGVTLWQRIGTSAWAPVTGVLHTSSTGVVSVSVEPLSSRIYQWRYGGNSTAQLATVGSETVFVH